ncbi:outer membrane beta-barrel protein [Fluviicola chungangensis]|uniref:PorT family protein n=1 Tax=Fluviicola chungangensis TaxID=2597671 RepID=A0A556MRE5_9FLAO|nr:outer membrane beta-barrel protein [Fluviicola chungangensis]TSJ42465.1 PorT family protein [Fluviicola chungangensis]
MMLNRILLLLAVLLISFSGTTQTKYTVHRKGRIYLGISGGMNFSAAHVVKDYNLLMITPQSSASNTDSEKDYQPLFKNKGSQFGLYFSYSFKKNLAIVFQPAYQTCGFDYRTAYSWSDTMNGSDFRMEMMHQQKLSGVNLPLLVRWDFTSSQFSPYVQAGIFANFRHQAKKTIFYDYTIDEEVDKKTADKTGEADLTEHINKANFGLSAGVGFTYFANYFAISLESNFRYGFRSIVNDQNRYADYTGFSVQYLDVMDQLKLMNLDIQLTVMFPIDNSISLGILRKSRH